MGHNDHEVIENLEQCLALLREDQKIEACRERALAITKIEEAQMWLAKARPS